MEDTVVFIDPSYDLYQSGHPNGEDERADFAAAYRGAAAHLGTLIGCHISVRMPPCSQYGGLPGGHVESAEWARREEVWQGIMDCVSLDDETGEWEWYEPMVEALASRITRKH